uniref:Uncharacterized protein n=1 Tax=Chenopodium quinoa TaxID=63459 RepID=A0A803M1V4_CHEQI
TPSRKNVRLVTEKALHHSLRSPATEQRSLSTNFPKDLKANSKQVSEAEIGLGLTGFGVFFTFLGVVLLFDKGLLAMGNGTISFGAGFFFVVIGWPIVGMILESYGFLVLFSGFWPTLSVFVQRIPVLVGYSNSPISDRCLIDTVGNVCLFESKGRKCLHL